MSDDLIKNKIEAEQLPITQIEEAATGENQIEQTPIAPEQAIEKPNLEKPEIVIPANTQKEQAAEGVNIISATNSQQQLAQRQKQIEGVLEKNLREIFIKMTPDKQREFKMQGEETARQINALLGEAKIKVKNIIDLIKKWLSFVPGVNKFFIEQESKIKTDEILKINNKQGF